MLSLAIAHKLTEEEVLMAQFHSHLKCKMKRMVIQLPILTRAKISLDGSRNNIIAKGKRNPVPQRNILGLKVLVQTMNKIWRLVSKNKSLWPITRCSIPAKHPGVSNKIHTVHQVVAPMPEASLREEQ